MPYIARYDDITNLWFAANGKFSEWNESLGSITQDLNAFVEMDSFKGQTAQNIKGYISEIHFTALISIAEILAEFQSRLLLYRDGWYTEVDNHPHALLQEEALADLRGFFRQSYFDFADEAEKVRSIASSISDLVPAAFPHEAAVNEDYFATSQRIVTLLNNTESYESLHYANDFVHLDAMLQALHSFLQNQLSRDTSYVDTYTPGNAAAIPGITALVQAVNASYENRAEMQDALAQAAKNEEARFALLEAEWAKQREEEGWLTFAVSALIVVGGVVCIVATAGIATPVVAPAVATGIGVAGAVVGTATVVYGAANMIESGQDIYYGMNGDYSTAAWNPVRDTVFGGNQQAYDIFGTVCVVSSSVLSLGAGAIGAAGAATSAGTNVTRAVAVYGAKTVATAGAGAAGGWAGKTVALELGASETMANLAGVLTGVGAGAAVGFGAQVLDQKNNWSGYYGKQAILNPENAKNPEAAPSERHPNWEKVESPDGFTLKENGEPDISHKLIPKEGDLFDRYGNDKGIYASPMEDGVPASYDGRSLPYEENPYARQQYRVTRDFSELPSAIENLTDVDLKADIMKDVNTHWGGDPNKIEIYTGTAAQAFDGTGGAPQIKFPLRIDYLIDLGFLEVVTPIHQNPSLYTASGLGALGSTKDEEN